MRTPRIVMICAVVLAAFTGFQSPEASLDDPSTISRSFLVSDTGERFTRTEILIDKTTSREDLIHTCKFLAREDVQLTFDQLEIRRWFFGLLGRSRITLANGRIEFQDGFSQDFNAGGIMGFRSIRIVYSENADTEDVFLNTVEVID
ncbi:MAG: hypothetical protein AAGA85_06875 [Bacteroidota bacterium]